MGAVLLNCDGGSKYRFAALNIKKVISSLAQKVFTSKLGSFLGWVVFFLRYASMQARDVVKERNVLPLSESPQPLFETLLCLGVFSAVQMC
jgi:hypothetical protein